MIASMFSIINQAITAFIGSLKDVFGGITELFVLESEGTYTWTFLGTLTLVTVGCGLVYLAYRVIRSLVGSRVAY